MRFRTLILLFLFFELFSLTGHFFPILNTVGFFLLLAAAAVASLVKLEYGLGMVLAELMIGGYGYLFSFSFGAAAISLRMGLFVVVMAVWAASAFVKLNYVVFGRPSDFDRNKKDHISLATGVTAQDGQKSKIFNWQTFGILKWWGLLGIIIILGFVIGLWRDNGFSNVFLDANGYFYAALILPFWWTITQKDAESDGKTRIFKNFGIIFFSATTWVAMKTLLSVYLFTHAGNNFIAANLLSFYRWVRETGVGEITWLPGNFARVFFQSHLFSLAAFFVGLSMLLFRRGASKEKEQDAKQNVIKKYAFFDDRQKMRTFVWCVLNASVIIISFSRSFWLGTLVGLATVLFFTWRRGVLRRALKIFFATALGAVLFLVIVSRFPLPQPSAMDLTSAAKSRLEYEAAASSRWNLWPPLWQAVKTHWLIGSGFGKTVTYISNDPRLRENSPTGLYTTYAFEWGWLDLWLKTGLIGLIVYIILLGNLFKCLYRQSQESILSLAGLIILFSLIMVHFFTPYLNHPLGLGILIILTLISQSEKTRNSFPS